MLRLDFTQHSIVVGCTLCSGWSELASSRAEGWRIAAAHERSVHPDLEQAREAFAKTRRAD